MNKNNDSKMDNCDKLTTLKSIIKCNDYYKFKKIINDPNNVIATHIPSFVALTELNQFLKLKDYNSKLQFINKFLTKRDCGLSEFSNDECICDRFYYINYFSNVSENFYNKFKDLIGDNKHCLN